MIFDQNPGGRQVSGQPHLVVQTKQIVIPPGEQK